ncbi:hypothetical protein, partial [Xanthomonas pisi]|uniref:hypothetical protein n=1 Tax=Xanthomonas pisi TaxID=56457 RepID=UPI001B802010
QNWGDVEGHPCPLQKRRASMRAALRVVSAGLAAAVWGPEKRKQGKAKQGKAKQSKAKQGKARQSKAKQGKLCFAQRTKVQRCRAQARQCCAVLGRRPEA